MMTSVSMRCLLLSTALALLGCGSECVLSEGKCPGGCMEVDARPLVDGPEGPCIGGDELLACMDKGDNLLIDACVVSSDGTIYFTNGTFAGRLLEMGYIDCAEED